jgi:transposase
MFLRLQAVLLAAQGLTADEVAVIENVSAQAVYNWVYRYLDRVPSAEWRRP